VAEDKKPKGPTAGARPKNWVAIKSLSGGVSSPTNSTLQETIGEPRNFRNTAPISRPDAPELTEGLPEEAQDNSFLGGFLNLMDRAVPDDLGGLIRGETGWINNVPFAGDAYENTAGRVLGTGLDAGSAVVNAMNWGSEKMNHLGAAAFSALPGGIETLTWDQANDISLGQVVTANSAINNNSFGGWLINVATLQTPFALMSAKSESDDPNNALYLENFNILNKEQREAAFESGGLGQTMSGYADAIWMVAADPTIIGGKASSILRIGSKVGEFGGLSNQSLRTAKQVSSFADRNTEQAAIIAKFGGDYKAAINSGELSTEGVRLADALNGTADSLINSVYVKNSPRKKTTLDILANETSMSNPAEGALVLNAISGHADSWVKIREVNKDLYDKLSTSMNQNIFDPVPGSAAADNMVGEISDMTTDQAKFGDELIEEAENARVAAIADEAGVIDGAPPVADEALDVFSGQLIERGGARIGAPLVRAAGAYRRGAASTNLQRNPLRKVQVPPTIPGNGHLVYDAIERTASSRPITAIRWVGKGTPNGIVDVKGGDGENSHREIANWLRRSSIQTDEATIYFNDFVAAQSPADRIAVIDRMELAYVKTVATKKNITPEAAQAVYDGYKAKRAMTLRNISKTKTKFYADPDTGEMIKVPMFYAELDATIPMIDTKIFSRVVGGHQEALRTVENLTELADQINKVWKLSVLIRLGYTQRNIAEGFLRGVAVSGMIMANPQAFAALPANILLSASVRRGLKGVATQERVLVQARDNLDNARGVLNQVFKDAGIAAGVSLRNDAAALTSQISKLKKVKTVESAAQIKKLTSKRDRLLAKANKIELTKTQPRLGQMNAARIEQNEAIRKVDELSKEIEDALTVLRIKDSRRKLLGKKGNVVAKDANGEDIIYAGAFEGPAGRAALLSSSADSTVRNVFEGSFQSRISSRNAQHDYDKIDPSKLAPAEMNVYWAEYAVRINRRYATDPVAQMIIRNEPIEDIKAWFTSPDGIRYRKDLGSPKNPMGNSTEIDTYLSKAIQRLDYELPQGSRLREISLRGDLTSTEVISAIGSSELPVLVGRLGSDEAVGLFKGAANKADTISSSLMKGLGSIPEDKLLRHPFYNNVYIARQKELGRLAQDQGQDLTSSVVQGRINRSAHSSALKATRETMYTIEELSNVSQLLRWVSPFFPAFENAIRTWGRIAYANPAVLGYGNLLWNVPNYMGMVVDENGDPVARSNMLKDENTWVILPREINNILQKRGIISPGQPMRVRQSGANVVFPGAEFWFPGAGPGLAVPLAAILRNKPEDQELLKNIVGENIYRQIVPNGNVNTNLVDSMLPTFVRRVKQMWQGETSDTAYISLFNDMVEDAYINAQLEGRNISSKDYAKIESDVDKFWRWQIGAAAIAPFQSAYASPHQLQRDSWRKLIDDQSIPYIDKIKAFKEEFGYEYLAITRSTSANETGLNPNLKTWSRIVENPSLVRDLYNINPELVGMFGNMGSFDDPFSYAVYGEFSGMKIGSDGKPVRSKLKPDQVLRNNQVVDGWSEYFQLMDAIESKVVQSGFSSLQVKDAQPLRDIRDETIALLSVKYEAWGQERSSYENSLPDFIVGARILVKNSTILNEDSTMRALSDYLTLREAISDKLSQTSDSDIRNSLKDIGYAAAFDLRQSDIGFADFYDKYLSSDDFRKIYGS